MSYEDLLQQSVQGYTERLQQLARTNSAPAFRAAVAALLNTIEAVQQRRAAMTAADCRFTIETLRGLGIDERRRLLNEHALGFGRPDAPTIVVGTEPAYELGEADDTVNFCLESCAQPVVLLSNGDTDVVAALSGDRVRLPPTRQFHIHPNDHYREGGSHTWGYLAKILGTGNEHRPGATPGLGDLCYQIDLSAFPSQHNSRGQLPTAGRVRFLRTAMTTFAATARCVIFHGRAHSAALNESRDLLIASFLGHAPASRDWVDESEPHRPLRHVSHGQRRVIITRGLSNAGMTNEFVVHLARLARGDDAERPRRRVITTGAVVRGPSVTTNAPDFGGASVVDRDRLLALCVEHGLATNRQKQWTQVGPHGAVRDRSGDPRLFYVEHQGNLVDLRRQAGPIDLIERARRASRGDCPGQIVARIPIDLFSHHDWIRLIQHNAPL